MLIAVVLALSETAQTVLLIGGIILGAIVVFGLSLFFWIFILKIMFWRWWTAVDMFNLLEQLVNESLPNALGGLA